jgi:hypothetical protein
MWMKLGTLNDIAAVEERLTNLIGEAKPTMNLVPVDGTIAISDADNGDKTIGVAIAQNANNALTAVEGGLFVPAVQIAEESHGLVAVEGALALRLATIDLDGAMSKGDKQLLGELKDAVDALNGICSWGEMQ